MLSSEDRAYVLEAQQHLYFFCQGCDKFHHVTIAKGGWTFNGNLVSPTINPSVKVTCEPYGKPKVTLCHCFVRNGSIEYLADCKHVLAGSKVPLLSIMSLSKLSLAFLPLSSRDRRAYSEAMEKDRASDGQ